MIEQVTPPGWGPPRHIHSREDEIFYILDGSYELHVGDERRTVSAGASAILPRNIPHGFRNVASTLSRLVFVITPGGLVANARRHFQRSFPEYRYDAQVFRPVLNEYPTEVQLFGYRGIDSPAMVPRGLYFPFRRVIKSSTNRSASEARQTRAFALSSITPSIS